MSSSSSVKSFLKLKAESLTVKRGLEVITGLVILVLGLALFGLGAYVVIGTATEQKIPINIPTGSVINSSQSEVLTILLLGALPLILGTLLIVGSAYQFYGTHRAEEKVVEAVQKRQESGTGLTDAESKMARYMEKISKGRTIEDYSDYVPS